MSKIQENREKYFETIIQEAKSDGASVVEKLQGVGNLVKLAENPTMEKMLEFAKNEFVFFFDKEIKKLLRLFPKDFIDKEGNVFWRSPKRAPSALEFNVDNEDHVNFVKSILNILSQIFTESTVGTMSFEDVQKGLKDLKDDNLQEEVILNEEEERKKALNKNNNTQDEDLSEKINELA